MKVMPPQMPEPFILFSVKKEIKKCISINLWAGNIGLYRLLKWCMKIYLLKINYFGCFLII
jgi:hypothetical protein